MRKKKTKKNLGDTTHMNLSFEPTMFQSLLGTKIRFIDYCATSKPWFCFSIQIHKGWKH